MLEVSGLGRYYSSPSCSSIHNWWVSHTWMVATSSWKTALLYWNSVQLTGCIWSLNLYTYSLTVIRLWSVAIGPTEYHDIAAQTSTEPPACRVSVLESGVLDWVLQNTTILLLKPSQNLPYVVFQCRNQVFWIGCSPNSSWCRGKKEGRLISPYHEFTVVWRQGFMVMVRYESRHYFE
jgi:hypothetical protein